MNYVKSTLLPSVSSCSASHLQILKLDLHEWCQRATVQLHLLNWLEELSLSSSFQSRQVTTLPTTTTLTWHLTFYVPPLSLRQKNPTHSPTLKCCVSAHIKTYN